MKKTNLKLLASAIALGVAAISTVSSSYAWFTMNNEAKATGMTVNASADSSLVIKGITGTTDTTYTEVGTDVSTLTTMKPCTSYDGVYFGKLTGAKVASAGSSTATNADGSALTSENLALISNTSNYVLASQYSLASVGQNAEAVYVKSITVTNNADKLAKAVRVAIKMDDTTLVFAPVTGNSASLVGKYDGTSTWSLTAPSYTSVNTTGANIGSLTASDSTYANAKTVVVSIWFEGQDAACYSDNVNTTNMTVDVVFTTVTPE